MFWNNICSKVDEGKTYVDYFVHKGPSGGVELVLQDLVGLGQPYDPFDVDPLGGDDPVTDNGLCWQLVDSSHGGWCINLDVFSCK